MFAKVIPFTKLPRKFEAFDYSVPREFEKKIKIGHIVAIYFRNQKIRGVVTGFAEKPQIKTERIKPLISLAEIILPETLLQTVRWASENYLVSPSLIYKLIIPPLPPHQLDEVGWYGGGKKALSLNKLQAQNIIKALGNLAVNKDKFFLYENNFEEVLAIFIKIAQKELAHPIRESTSNGARKKQVLLLVPTLEDIKNFAPYLASIFGDRLIVWRGKMAKGERFSGWLKILNGSPAIILGTRPACFLPFQNLSAILIYNCTSPDLKQWDQNPRYDSRIVAEKLQEIFGWTHSDCRSAKREGAPFRCTQLVFSDILPDLKNFKNLRDGKMSALNEVDSAPAFTIADIRKEKKSAPFFSFPIYQLVEEGLAKKQKIILFINRKEKKSLFFCNDCRKTLSCPECGRPFGVDGGRFLCYYCNIQNPLPLNCPDCRGTNMKILSLGAENIKKSANKEFPAAKIEIAAKNKAVADNSDILIATDYFWKNILLRMEAGKIYGAALLDFDFYLARPEFNQKETALLALYRFFNFAKNYRLKKALVQTAFPESDLFGQPEMVYAKELKEREESGYPPFYKLIKIICKASDRSALERESQELYRRLKDKGFNPLPPFEPYVKKRSKNYLKHIILKENLNKGLEQLKNIVPDEYQIDVDPISIY